jgi:hypothetical protein
MYINKEAIYAAAVNLIANNGAYIWDYADDDRAVARQAIYYQGVADLAVALAKEYEK